MSEGASGTCEVDVTDLERRSGRDLVDTMFWHTGPRARHYGQLTANRWRYQTATAGYPGIHIETPARDHHPRAHPAREVRVGVFCPDQNFYFESVASAGLGPLAGAGATTWQGAVYLAGHFGFLSSPAGTQGDPA